MNKVFPNPIMLALDTSSLDEAKSLALKLKDHVVDTTGAGDAFNGAFAVALANDLKHQDALIFANKVAGISTTRAGAASSMPTLKEVNNY